MHENEEATDQLEEVSGRWLRDQLRDISEGVGPASNGGGESEESSSQLIEGLAASISEAVAEPIRGLESRREAKQRQLEAALQELSGKLGDAFVEIAKLKDEAAGASARADEAQQMAKREVEAARAEFRQDAEQLSATTVDLRDGFSRLAEEVGRVQEKVREEHERIDALRFRETQRAKALSELEKASASLKDALSAAAALSAPQNEQDA